MRQPLFYPGKKLDAQDLINLEEYAFSRVNMLSPDHGVVSLYNDGAQPDYSKENDQYYFVLKEIRGITPEGRPIKFKAEGTERPALKLLYPSHGVFIWDIYMDDSHPAGKADADPLGEKYRLSHRLIASYENKQTDELIQTQPPAIEKKKLYIGRYRLSAGHPPEIIAPPYIFSLASFNFPSQWWHDWTYAIRQALRKIAEDHKSEYVENFVKHILYNYPFWPLSQLLKASNELAWLCTEASLGNLLDEGAMSELQQTQISNPLPSAVYNISPFEIPTKISQILGSLQRKDWKLIPAKQYDLIEGTLTVNLALEGRHEIKFRFKTGIEVNQVERLFIDNFFERNPIRFSEKDGLKDDCFCYVIECPGTSGANKFNISVPKKWEKSSFSLYYRTVVEK